MWSKCLPALGAIVLLTACDMRIGNDASESSENASAAGRAEEGRLTIDAPGFNMSVNIPESIRTDAKIDEDNHLIYPGSKFGGIHVQDGRDRAGGSSDGEVELRFSTGDPLDRVAAWYRDPARGEKIIIASAERQGDGFLISGTVRPDKDSFALRITPRAGGGTEGRLLLSDRR